MKNTKFLIFEKILLGLLLATSVVGFWYFEPSLTLRIIALFLAVISFAIAFFIPGQKTPIFSSRELVILLVLYFSLLTLYNLLYGLNISLYMIMLAVLIMVCLSFFVLLTLDGINNLLGKPVFNLFIILVGLAVLEIFLGLSFWPIDPKFKSLIIIVIFYLITNLVYLFSHSMLKLNKIVGYLIVSILILGGILLGINFRFLQ